MSIKLRLKHSSVADKAPLPTDLVEGELALNINNTSPAAYIKDSTGVVRRIAGITVGGTAPAAPTAGVAWLDITVPTKPVFKIYDGTAWQGAGAGSGVSVGAVAPAAPAAGTLWVDTTAPTAPVLKVYNGTAFVTVTPDATEIAKGIVELATAAETTTGTDDTRAVHPAGLKVELDKKATKTITSDTAPTSPADGDLWYDSVGGELYVWYDSDDAGAVAGTWVQANPQPTPKQAPTYAAEAVLYAGADGKPTAAVADLRLKSSSALYVGNTTAAVNRVVAGGDSTTDFYGCCISRGAGVNSEGFLINYGNGQLGLRADGAGDIVFGRHTTEAMRLTHGGGTSQTLLLGATASIGVNARAQIQYPGGAAMWGIGLRPEADGTTALAFLRAADGGIIGSISVSSVGTTYNTVSDERRKKNIAASKTATDSINAIKIRSFDWIANDEHVDYGVIAQELALVAPDAVTEGPVWAVDCSKLVPRLIKAVQELSAEVQSLKETIK